MEKRTRKTAWSIGLPLFLLAMLVSYGNLPDAEAQIAADSLVTYDGEVASPIQVDNTGSQSVILPFGSVFGVRDVAYDSTRNDVWFVRSTFGGAALGRFDNDTGMFIDEPTLSAAISGEPRGVGIGGPGNNTLVVSWVNTQLPPGGLPVTFPLTHRGVTCFDLGANTSQTVTNAQTLTGGDFDSPSGVAVSQAGQVLVADPTANPTTGAIIEVDCVNGTATSLISGFGIVLPVDLEFFSNSSGQLAVLDQQGAGPLVDAAVYVFDPTVPAPVTPSPRAQGNLLLSGAPTHVTTLGDNIHILQGSSIVQVDMSGTQSLFTSGNFLIVPAGLTARPASSPPPAGGFSVFVDAITIPAWVARLVDQFKAGAIAISIPALGGGDDDNDGVRNFDDDCANTPPNVPINKEGCSADQAATLGVLFAGFDFDDGTLQGFTADGGVNVIDDSGNPQVFPPSPPILHGTRQFPFEFPLPGQTLGSAQMFGTGVLANVPASLSTPGTRQVFVDFVSPDVSNNPDWQGIDGFQACVRSGITLAGAPGFAQAILESYSGQFFAETDALGNFAFHPLSLFQWVCWTASINLPPGVTVDRVRVRIFTNILALSQDPGFGTWEVALDLVTPHRDTDRDGIPNALERIRNLGGVQINCAFTFDCDNDGLTDGPFGSEDLNGNGKFEPEFGETDPTNPDTDGDGIPDGTEEGLTAPQTIPGGLGGTDLAAGNFVADPDPASTTDPRDPETRGAGSPDCQPRVVTFEAFNDPSGVLNVFDGIDWGGEWRVDEQPCGACLPQLAYFDSSVGMCREFTFAIPSRLDAFDASVHTQSAGQVTLEAFNANGDPVETFAGTVTRNACQTFTTAWSRLVSRVKVCFEFGWEMAFDNVTFCSP